MQNHWRAIKKARQRLVLCRLMIDMMRTVHGAYAPASEPFGTRRAVFSPGFLFRDGDLLRDGDDSIGFVIAQSRELTATHLEREIRLATGDATMMLAGATGGVGSRESFALFDMLIPPAEWEARGARPEDGLMQRLWGKSEAMQLLRSYIGFVEKKLTTSVDDRSIIRWHTLANKVEE